MGCCISKCNPKRKTTGIQDKLVVSQSPARKRKTTESTPSITSVSLSCLTEITTSSSSSSSVAFSKIDRSFSNDFLQSCAMENLQIIGLENPINKVGEKKQMGQESLQKRARAGSPNLSRQKSFRVEKERLEKNLRVECLLPAKRYPIPMRSPSPSRRFNGHTTTTNDTQSSHRRGIRKLECRQSYLYPKVDSLLPEKHTNNYKKQPMLSANTQKANTRPESPNRNVISKERPICLNDSENFEGVKVGRVLSKVNYSGDFAVEDLDNPHIALDCFIFL